MYFFVVLMVKKHKTFWVGRSYSKCWLDNRIFNFIHAIIQLDNHTAAEQHTKSSDTEQELQVH